MKEFIDYCNDNKGKVTYASSGNGTTLHLSRRAVQAAGQGRDEHVPYRGGAPAINDLIPGRVDVIFDNMPSIISHVSSGAVRGLAVTTRNASCRARYADHRRDRPGVRHVSWFGFFVPAKTPKEIMAKINADANAALVYSGVKTHFKDLGTMPKGSTQAELAAFLKSETDKWTR